MSEGEIDDLFQQLRQEYLGESADRVAELRAGAAAFRNGSAEAAASLKTHFHRLAGSGGSYGFPSVSAIAKEAELWIATGPAPDAAAAARLEDAIDRLEAEFAAEQRKH